MACKEDRYAVSDRVYYIRQMPPRLAVPVEVYLAKTLGRPLFEAFTRGGLDAESTFGLAIGLLTERLDDASLLGVMHKVFQYVGIDGTCVRVCDTTSTDGLDTHFIGRNRELWQVFLRALQVNFADFFGDALSRSTLLGRLKRAWSMLDPATSTSTSGAPASPTPPSAGTSTSSRTAPTL